jgi:hypothetical protein
MDGGIAAARDGAKVTAAKVTKVTVRRWLEEVFGPAPERREGAWHESVASGILRLWHKPEPVGKLFVSLIHRRLGYLLSTGVIQ